MRFFFALLPTMLLAHPAMAQTIAPSPEIEAIAPDALLPPPDSVPGVSRTDERTLSRDERLNAVSYTHLRAHET